MNQAQPHNHDLATYLRANREAAGLSIRQLAAMAGIDNAYLTRLEGGEKRNPSADVLLAIGEALQLDASVLLGFIGVKPSAILPSPRMYFRRKLGMNASDAEILARLVEDFQEAQHAREGGRHAADNDVADR
jgi:transcriptional regulator with XRE-family HTH domain